MSYTPAPRTARTARTARTTHQAATTPAFLPPPRDELLAPVRATQAEYVACLHAARDVVRALLVATRAYAESRRAAIHAGVSGMYLERAGMHPPLADPLAGFRRPAPPPTARSSRQG